jgi:hypothetical protein
MIMHRSLKTSLPMAPGRYSCCIIGLSRVYSIGVGLYSACVIYRDVDASKTWMIVCP